MGDRDTCETAASVATLNGLGVGGEVRGELTAGRWDGPSPRLEVIEVGAVDPPRGGGDPGLNVRLDLGGSVRDGLLLGLGRLGLDSR